jgi:hypothetical protein
MRRSTDHGNSWLNEQILTDTHWGSVSQVSTDGSAVFVTWHRSSTLFHVEARFSNDAGLTWCPIVDLTPSLLSWERALDPSSAIGRSIGIVSWGHRDSTRRPFYVKLRSGILHPVSVDDSGVEGYADLTIFQPYPNPLNAATVMKYFVAADTRVGLSIYDVLGKEVTVLVDGEEDAGWHETVWTPESIGSGVYFYHFIAGNQSAGGKLVLLK